MSYLNENEIEEYCGLVSGVTMQHVEAASALIDAYKGLSFLPYKRVEKVEIRKKHGQFEMRGKLKHFPRVEIQKIVSSVRTVFGEQETEFPVSCLEFDEDTSPYFTFYVPSQYMFHPVPKYLRVEYISGYEIIPEQIKRACGILAGNIKQMGGVMKWKSRDDYDIKVTLTNEGVFTEEVKSLLRGVRVQ